MSDLYDRAHSGDPEAIATLLNQIFVPRGVTARVTLKEDSIQVLLVSERLLNQQAFVSYVQRQLISHQIPHLQVAEIYSQQLGETTPAWSQTVAIADSENGKMTRRNTSATQTRDFLTNLRSFQLEVIFPYRSVFDPDLYRLPIVRLLLFFGLFPLLVDLVADQATLAQMAWLLGIYYASIWGVVLYNLIKPSDFSWSDTLKCVLFTTFIGIPLLLTLQRVPPFNALYGAINRGFLFRLAGFVLGVGILEETCKGLPVYLFLLRAGKLSDPLTSAFYGAMSGLGFAIAEGATYSLVYGFGLSRGQLNLGTYVVANTIRFVSLPLFHAILSGIVGYFIGLAALNPARQGAILFIGVAIAAIIHGLYNTFAGGVVGLAMIGFSILLFVTYLRRSRQMMQEMQAAESLKQPDDD